MLTSLKIQNFRAFRFLEMNDLGAVNLIVGKNNSGKTSLLEAVYLISRGGSASAAFNLQTLRFPTANLAEHAAQAFETYIKHLFHQQKIDAPIQIEAAFSDCEVLRLTLALASKPDISIPLSADYVQNLAVKAKLRRVNAEIKSESRAWIEGAKILMDPPGADEPLFHALFHRNRGGGAESSYAQMMGELRRRKKEGAVLSSLKIIEPDLKEIADISFAGSSLLFCDIGLPEMVPLSLLGDGVSGTLRLILKLAAAQGGAALIDEIENGLHYSVQSDVWAAIDEAARQSDTQIFAATHSLECVKAAHKSIGADRLRLHRLQKKGGEIRCVTYSQDAINGALKFNLEVR